MEQPWLPLAFYITPRAPQRATYHQACSRDVGKLFGRCIGCPGKLCGATALCCGVADEHGWRALAPSVSLSCALNPSKSIAFMCARPGRTSVLLY